LWSGLGGIIISKCHRDDPDDGNLFEHGITSWSTLRWTRCVSSRHFVLTSLCCSISRSSYDAVPTSLHRSFSCHGTRCWNQSALPRIACRQLLGTNGSTLNLHIEPTLLPFPFIIGDHLTVHQMIKSPTNQQLQSKHQQRCWFTDKPNTFKYKS